MKTIVLLLVLITSNIIFAEEFWTKIPNIDLSVRNITYNQEGDMIASINDGIIKSYDGGETWVRKATLGKYAFPLDIVMNHEGHLYVSLHSNIIIKSLDHGETWFSIYSLPHRDPKLLYHPSNKLYATPFVNGLYVSDDEGKSFSKVTSLETPSIWQMDFDSKGTIYAGTDEHIFISQDTGKTWIQSEINVDCNTANALKVLPNDNIIFGSKGSRCGLFISYDSGETWNQINEGFDLWNYLQVEDIHYVDNDQIFVVTNAYGVFRTLNGGESWDQLPLIDGVDLYWKAFVDKHGILFLGANNGMYKSNSRVLDVNEELYRDIKIVPNPVDDFFYIEGIELEQISNIKILNSVGEEMINSAAFSSDMTEALSSGVYFMMIEYGNQTKLIPFIKR